LGIEKNCRKYHNKGKNTLATIEDDTKCISGAINYGKNMPGEYKIEYNFFQRLEATSLSAKQSVFQIRIRDPHFFIA
jgi:hypothetical protein